MIEGIIGCEKHGSEQKEDVKVTENDVKEDKLNGKNK